VIRRVAVSLGSLTASALLVVALPMSAHAAVGVFEYTTGQGPQVINNPSDGRCYSTSGAFAANNNTNRNAELYRSDSCTGTPARVLSPFESIGFATFATVKFES
jgi:hypothetical protein